MEIYTKEISKEELKQDLANNILKMEINMKEITHQINSMKKVNTYGKMVQCIKEIL
jgi:signal recognition particle GTPase